MPERSILSLYVVARQSNKHYISGFGSTGANCHNKYLNGSFREHMNPTGSPQPLRKFSVDRSG